MAGLVWRPKEPSCDSFRLMPEPPFLVRSPFLPTLFAAPNFSAKAQARLNPADSRSSHADIFDDLHGPRWAPGFRKFAFTAGTECRVKPSICPADDRPMDTWDVVARGIRL